MEGSISTECATLLNLRLAQFVLCHHQFAYLTSLKPHQPSLQLRPRARCKPSRIGMRKLANEGQNGHVCEAGLVAE